VVYLGALIPYVLESGRLGIRQNLFASYCDGAVRFAQILGERDVKILVTGAAGFIGSHLCERLLEDGHEVLGIDAFIPYYPRAQKERNISRALSNSKFTFIETDLRTAPLEGYLSKVDSVVHEAAMPGLPASWVEFDLYMTCNIQATRRLLEACLKAKIRRFVHVSTSSVYGLEATGNEDSMPQPISPYGITKLAAEQLCRAYQKNFGLPIVICRYFSVFGPRQRPDMAYDIFIRALMAGEKITVFGDGAQSRGNTYVDDCVEATILALMKAPAGEIYNVGGGTEATLMEVVGHLEQLTGKKATLEYRASRPGDQRRTFADTSKIRTQLGWEPKVDLREGLRRQVEYIRSG
jgi:UDP-glucuronate 4-epimerase